MNLHKLLKMTIGEWILMSREERDKLLERFEQSSKKLLQEVEELRDRKEKEKEIQDKEEKKRKEMGRLHPGQEN